MPLSRRETSLMRRKKIICLGERKSTMKQDEPGRGLHASWHSNAKNRDGPAAERLTIQTQLTHVNTCMQRIHRPAVQKVQTLKPH